MYVSFVFESSDKPRRNHDKNFGPFDDKYTAVIKLVEFIKTQHEKEYPKISCEHINELTELLHKHFEKNTMFCIDETGYSSYTDVPDDKEHLTEYFLTRYFMSTNKTCYYIDYCVYYADNDEEYGL